MKISTTVVIPNWNGLSYLKECLASLKEQTRPFKLLVVDNGSDDGSAEYLSGSEFLEEYPHAKALLLSKNTGFCHAVNLGVRYADTDYIFLLNNDTLVDKECLEKLEDAAKNAPKAFGVQALMLNAKGDRIDSAGDLYCALGWAYSGGKGKPYLKGKKGEGRTERVFSACGGAMLCRRKLFLKLGGFDEAHFAYLEDLDLCYRANIRGYRNYICPEALVLHAGSASTGTRHNPFKVFHAARNNILLLAKNMPPLQILLNAPLLLAGGVVKYLYFTTKGLGKYYSRGVRAGFRMSAGRRQRNKHVTFEIRNIPQYIGIQADLWYNMLALFVTLL